MASRSIGLFHRRALAGLGAVALGLGVMTWLAAPSAAMARPDQDSKEAADASADTVIFRNGNTIRCTVLEETETSVKVRLSVAGISTETVYPKSDILEVKIAPKKDAPAGKKPEAVSAVKGEDSGAMPATTSDTDSKSVVDEKDKPIPPGTLKVYVVTFGGEFGRNVSKTPVQEWMKDVLRVQPDVLIVRFDHEFMKAAGDSANFAHVGSESWVYSQLTKAQEIDTLITDRLSNDPAFKTKPRLVAWIHRALGGGAFLPFVFPEIYFASDGYHGGIGGLDQLFKSMGDEVAQRKQQSLRMAWIVGLCQKGGHDSKIVRAMAWSPYILSYRLSGGQVEWLEDKMPTGPDWNLLKDDGAVTKEHADSMEDMVRMKGNDFLTLNANTAEIIGFSKGTADTVDDLLFKMGVTRNYALVKNRSKTIFKDWGDQVTKAEDEFNRLWRKYNGVQIRNPGGYPERSAARGERKKLLLQIESLLEKYAEAIDPSRIKGAPESWSTQIRLLINQIETEQRLDKP